jgi:voltage-gated potassium channel
LTSIVQPAREGGARAATARFLHHPVTELALLVLIVASIGLLLVETGYPDDSPTRQWLQHVADGITYLFIVELSARFWVARKQRSFLRRYWIDCIAVLPLVRSFRLLRALRLLRLFRAGALASRRLTAFGGVFRAASPELTLLASITIVIILASAVVLFLAERGTNPELAAFDQSVWFSVYSLIANSPVGAAPQTGAGRAVMLVVMLGGLTVFGIFVGTISAAMGSRLLRRKEVHEMDLDELSGHVVVCGWNRAGGDLLRELVATASIDIVLVTEGPRPPDDVPDEIHRTGRLYHVSGDHTRVDVLRAAGIDRAATVVLLADALTPRPDQDRDARTVLAGLTIERLAPTIFTCAELTNRENAALLTMAGVDEIVVPHEYSGVILGSVGRTRGLVEVLDEILTTTHGNGFHKVEIPAEDAGCRTVAELHRQLKEKHNAILVSLERRGSERKRELLVNPSPETEILPGDRAVVIAANPVNW